MLYFNRFIPFFFLLILSTNYAASSIQFSQKGPGIDEIQGPVLMVLKGQATIQGPMDKETVLTRYLLDVVHSNKGYFHSSTGYSTQSNSQTMGSSAIQFSVQHSFRDSISNNDILRVKQSIHGYELFNTFIKAHVNDTDELTYLSGFIAVDIPVNREPTVSLSQAKSSLGLYHETAFLTPPQLVYILHQNQLRLVWHLHYQHRFDDIQHYFIDAFHGQLIHQYSGICTFSLKTYSIHSTDVPLDDAILRYEANQSSSFQLHTPIDEPINNILRTAHQHFIDSYDYFFTDLGTDTSRFTTPLNFKQYIFTPNNTSDKSFDAFFSISGSFFYYGNGLPRFSYKDHILESSYLSNAPDVVGHEFTHSITSSFSQLTYRSESGALNESLSDIFGYLIQAKKSNFLSFHVAEKAFTNQSTLTSLRHLKTPSLSDLSIQMMHSGLLSKSIFGVPLISDGILKLYQFLYYPATVEQFHVLDTYDSGGIHINSSIINKSFAETLEYLGNTSQNRDFLSLVYHRANTHHLTPASDFDAFVAAIFKSADDFYQNGQWSYSTYLLIKNALQHGFESVGFIIQNKMVDPLSDVYLAEHYTSLPHFSFSNQTDFSHQQSLSLPHSIYTKLFFDHINLKEFGDDGNVIHEYFYVLNEDGVTKSAISGQFDHVESPLISDQSFTMHLSAKNSAESSFSATGYALY